MYRSTKMNNPGEEGEDRVAETGKTVGKIRQPLSGSQNLKLNQPKILNQLHPEPDQNNMWTKFVLFFLLISTVMTSPVPILIGGQLLTTEELDPKEHQILFRRRGKYAVDVNFHHVHIPINLNKFSKWRTRPSQKSKLTLPMCTRSQ